MNESIISLLSLTSIAILLVFLFWAYRDYCVDSFRQKMFTLRDAFFDEATEKNIDFDSGAYGMLRATMNGFIRFGHRLSFGHFIVIVIALNRHNPRQEKVLFYKRLEDSYGALSHDQKKIVLDYYSKMNLLLVHHLLLSSPLLLLTIIVPLAVALEATRCVGKALKALRIPIDRLDSFALAEGET